MRTRFSTGANIGGAQNCLLREGRKQGRRYWRLLHRTSALVCGDEIIRSTAIADSNDSTLAKNAQ
jgi:hypothetical protein